MIVSLNGVYLAEDAAGLKINDRGFLLGDGFFTTLRVQNRRVLHLSAHLARLAGCFSVRRCPVPVSSEELARRVEEVRARNTLQSGAMRISISLGPGPRGVSAPAEPDFTVLIAAHPQDFTPLPPAKIGIATVTRRNEMSPVSRIKSLNYLDNILVRREAADQGWDDALVLNTQGRVAETSMANVFFLSDQTLVTPSVAEGALPGVVRAEVLRLAGELDLCVKECAVHPRDLTAADGLFLTNSLIGLRPVAELAGRALRIPDWLPVLETKVFQQV